MTLQPWPLGLGPCTRPLGGETRRNSSGQSNFQWAEPLSSLCHLYFFLFLLEEINLLIMDITINNEARVECPHILKPRL